MRLYTTYVRSKGIRSVDWAWAMEIDVSGDEAGRKESSNDGSGHDFASAHTPITAEPDMTPVKSSARRLQIYSHRDVGGAGEVDRSLRLVDEKCCRRTPILRREISTPHRKAYTMRVLKSIGKNEASLQASYMPNASSFRL